MNKRPALATIILAAGKGTRMKSPQAKVLHEVFFQPMIHHVLNAVTPLAAARSIVIVGHQKESVEEVVSSFDVACVEQKEQHGTGHAVLCAESELADFNGNVMILCGDSPLLLTRHLEEMTAVHESAGNVLTIMTTRLENPANYGRIITDTSGNVVEVVEEKDATPEQRQITEINAGIYYADKKFLFDALKHITTDNAQGEMYLTDIVAIAVGTNHKVGTYEHPCPAHVLGVNSRVELSLAHKEIQARRNRDLMETGITMFDPATISIGPQVTIGSDCTLTQNITVTGKSRIGRNCVLEPGVQINSAILGDNVRICANAVVTGCTIHENVIVDPGKIIGA